MSLLSFQHRTYISAGIVSALASGAPGALSNDLALEEIIVTANKRESLLLETAGSVSAFDAASFELLGIEGSDDLTARVPSLTISTFRISIRGIGRPNLAVGSEPGVGVYWDGVYNTENGIFNYARNMDIDRIEVLRGPQGTLYGRNSIAGAISYYSKRPTEEWAGTVTGEVTNYDGRLVQGYASGPVTDKLGVLAGVSVFERSGYQQNNYNGKDYDQDETPYATLGFQHKTTDNWTTNVKFIGVKRNYRQGNGYILEPFSRDAVQTVIDEDGGSIANLPGMFPGQNFVNMRQGLAVSNPALTDERDVKQDTDPSLRNDRWAVFLNSEYQGEDYSLKYTFGYNRYWFDTVSDADASVREDSGLDWSTIFPPVIAATGHSFTPSDMTYEVDQQARFSSHELQFSSEWSGDLQMLAGLYYYNSDEEQLVTFREWNDDLLDVYRYLGSLIPGPAARPVSDDNYLYRGEAEVDTKSYAAYSQLSWDWTDDTVITAGLRFSYDDKKGNDSTFVQFVADENGNATIYREEENNWDEITWRLGIDHTLSDTQFLYAFVATGYRSGGFNFQKPSGNDSVDVVEPESLTSYEIGYKGSVWDRRVNFGVSAYYYDYTDLQVLKQDVENGISLNTFVNADEAAAWGVELESTAQLTEHILVSGTYSWNDSEYKEFFTKDANACTLGPLAEGRSLDPLCQSDLNLEGNQFPTMPEHKLSLNLTYLWDMFDLRWAATTTYIYRDMSWSTAFNNPEYDELPSYDSWNARISATTQDRTWRVTGFMRNIEDDREVISRGRPSTVTRNAVSGILPPRITGVTVDYNF